MKDTCRIVAHGRGWCDWNSDFFFNVPGHRAGSLVSASKLSDQQKC